MRFCEFLRSAKEHKNMTVADIMEITGLHRNTVTNHLCGHTFPSLDVFLFYQDMLNIADKNVRNVYYAFLETEQTKRHRWERERKSRG